MSKTILITGSTDGIGLETAKLLLSQGHHVLLHGRNAAKLAKVEKALAELTAVNQIESYIADLSKMADVEAMAKSVIARHKTLDILVNNAGVFKVPTTKTAEGLDMRFAVNTVAPYLLMQQLLPLMSSSSRVINLSSAAQSPVNIDALTGKVSIEDDFTAYAQSKLALTMWTRAVALTIGSEGPKVIAVNPGSMLGTKMVKQAFGVAGKSILIGANIIIRAALSDEFEAASGRYFDNDSGQFTTPHSDMLDMQKTEEVVRVIETILAR